MDFLYRHVFVQCDVERVRDDACDIVHHLVDFLGRDDHVRAFHVHHSIEYALYTGADVHIRRGFVQCGFHKVLCDGGRIDDKRHAQRQHRYAERLLIQRFSFVADARTRRNAGIGDLYRGAHTFHTAGRKRIHRDYKRRLHPLYHAFDDLACLYARNAQHTGGNRAHVAKALVNSFGCVFVNMPRHKNRVADGRPKRIGCHHAVPQPHHQHDAVQRVACHIAYLVGQRDGAVLVELCVAARELLRLYRHIDSFFLTDGLFAFFV